MKYRIERIGCISDFPNEYRYGKNHRTVSVTIIEDNVPPYEMETKGKKHTFNHYAHNLAVTVYEDENIPYIDFTKSRFAELGKIYLDSESAKALSPSQIERSVHL